MRVRVTVINAGVYGYNTQQEALFFKKEILPNICPKPDLVIVSFTTNDTLVQGVMPRHPWINHCESYWHFWFPEFIKSRINRLLNKNKEINTSGFAKSGDFFPIKVRLANPIVPKKDAFTDTFLGWKRCREALQDLKMLSEDRKFNLLVMIMPDFSEDLRSYPLLFMHNKVKEYCNKISVKILDLFPYFSEKNNKELQNIEIHDDHPNAKAHTMMARIIKDHVKEFIQNRNIGSTYIQKGRSVE